MILQFFSLGSDNGIYSYELPQVFSAQQKDDSLAGRKLIYSLPNEFKISGRGLSKVNFLLVFLFCIVFCGTLIKVLICLLCHKNSHRMSMWIDQHQSIFFLSFQSIYLLSISDITSSCLSTGQTWMYKSRSFICCIKMHDW